MTRGNLVAVTEEGTFVSVQYNGDMYPEGNGRRAMEVLAAVRDAEGFRRANLEFDAELFGYASEGGAMWRAVDAVDFDRDYFADWNSDWAYVKNATDAFVTTVCRGGGRVVIWPGDTVAFNFGRWAGVWNPTTGSLATDHDEITPMREGHAAEGEEPAPRKVEVALRCSRASESWLGPTSDGVGPRMEMARKLKANAEKADCLIPGVVDQSSFVKGKAYDVGDGRYAVWSSKADVWATVRVEEVDVGTLWTILEDGNGWERVAYPSFTEETSECGFVEVVGRRSDGKPILAAYANLDD